MAAQSKAITFVGTLLQLLVVGRLLDDVEDGIRELRHQHVTSACLVHGGGEAPGGRGVVARTCESASGYALGFTVSPAIGLVHRPITTHSTGKRKTA